MEAPTRHASESPVARQGCAYFFVTTGASCTGDECPWWLLEVEASRGEPWFALE